ncbi:MarR family EPS-associated transcriptional regulator [Ramlibacter sp.]|uniref:MarR family EPS-associated transcriptional regulator n=1 Tax=Ramlibacter sp. TaxID=1917967 RepID=UPI003D119078
MNAPAAKRLELYEPAAVGSPSEPAVMLTALRLLSADPQLSQRELSRALGLSLGKTHYVLHALLDKGLLKVRNFRRANNKLAYSYLLTPKGMREKLEMTRRFLASKEAEWERLQGMIDELRGELRQQGPERIGEPE